MTSLPNCRKLIATTCSLIVLASLSAGGCRLGGVSEFHAAESSDCYCDAAAEIAYPATSACTDQMGSDLCLTTAPWTLDSGEMPMFRDIALEEVISTSLINSRVLRDLGGTTLRAPANTRTAWDAAVTETDGRQGIEAALSEFDARLTSDLFFDKNDRSINNEFAGGGTRALVQDLMNWDTAITKKAATGTQFSVRHHLDYDANNAPGNQFVSAWQAWLEGEFRHPLLQGSGVEFNRIAGPTDAPGVYNGVLIARLNTDVQLTELEIASRDLVSNLENAYWDLYYAYRDLDTKIAARDAALATWRTIQAKKEAQRRGGEAEKEAQAREQYYRFEEEVQNALAGRPVDGTRTFNGSSGGTFRAIGGVQVAERRLRMLMGLPPADGALLRPTEEPSMARLMFDWSDISCEAQLRRAELRRQKWQIRRHELELIASKNHLLPRLDAVGRYRWRGLGDTPFDDRANAAPPPLFFDSAYGQLTSGDTQEWQLGVELSVPIGFRRAHAGVRNAELSLARERAILEEQQRQVLHGLASAIAEMDRAYVVSQTSYNRLLASRDQLDAATVKFEDGAGPLDMLLDAQQRVANAESQYFRCMVDYAIAVKNVHYCKGTLLEYDGVALEEGNWPAEAHRDAWDRELRRGKPKPLNYASGLAPKLAEGDFLQRRSLPAGDATPAPQSSPDRYDIEPLPEMIDPNVPAGLPAS